MVTRATFRPRPLAQSRPSGEFFVPGFDLYETLEAAPVIPTEDVDFPNFYMLFKNTKLSRSYSDSKILDLFVKYDKENCGVITPIQYEMLIDEVSLYINPSQRPYPNRYLYQLDGIAWLRQYLYNTLEDFNFSKAAMGTQIFSMTLITVSTACVVLESVESLRDNLEFVYVESIASIIFTVEYLVRLACCRKPRLFVTTKLNIIDLISLLPFYIELSGVVTGVGAIRAVRTIRLVRMVRMLKLGFFADYMVIFSETLEYAKHSFTMLGILLLFPLVIFASLTFSVEAGFGSKLSSIFDAMYFVVVTMTTLGYGDQYPITPTGKVIVCFTVFTGIIYLTLAIQVIGNCFAKAYGNYLTRVADRKRTAALRLSQEVDSKSRRGSLFRRRSRRSTMLISLNRSRSSSHEKDIEDKQNHRRVRGKVIGAMLTNESVHWSRCESSEDELEKPDEMKFTSSLIRNIESLVIKTTEITNILQLLKIEKVPKFHAATQILDRYNRLQREISTLGVEN